MIFLKINLNLLVQISHLRDKIQTPYPAHKILHDFCSSQPRTYLLTFVHLDSFPGTFLSIHPLANSVHLTKCNIHVSNSWTPSLAPQAQSESSTGFPQPWCLSLSLCLSHSIFPACLLISPLIDEFLEDRSHVCFILISSTQHRT